MTNLKQIIEENEQNFEEWLIRNIFSRFPTKKEEELVESAISAFDVTQLRLIEGFREMVRERIGMVDIAIKSVDEKEGLDSYFGGQKLILNRLLSELGSINEIK